MKCYQCNRPAVFSHGEGKGIQLCLDCSHKLQSILNAQFLQHAAMMNQALDDMDMISGIYLGGGRLPVPELARAMQKAPTFNNINVTNSNVGVINTGDLAKIDAAITITEGTDAENIGNIIKNLAQSILDSREIDNSSKNAMMELVQEISQQLVRERKKSVIMALLSSLEEMAKGANAILNLVKSLAAGISDIFM